VTGKKIAVVTGSRAEFGILHWVIADIRDDDQLELALLVTGSHLEVSHGHTVSEIEQAGFPVAARVPIDLHDDSATGIAHSMAKCLTGMVEAIGNVSPDIVLLLGDRFEIFAAAQAAMLLRIPIAHIAGGDVTEGAIDDVMRHSITKMAHLHFATNIESAERILAMGEQPDHIFVTGSPALDHLHRTPLLDHQALEKSLGATLGTRNFLLTFHPVTLEQDFGIQHLEHLLAVLDVRLTSNDKIWVTRSNADSGGKAVNAYLEDWCSARSNRHIYTSLGQSRYLSLLAKADAVLGNSSSGLYEAPSFGTPTVNIGNRQGGRLIANSVFSCEPDSDSINDAITCALAFDRHTAYNPYGDGRSSARILAALKEAPPRRQLLHKLFFRGQN
jgi:UDP-hydrolysing UDP-N-acetyl-D-glucosamine 2-epimerase